MLSRGHPIFCNARGGFTLRLLCKYFTNKKRMAASIEEFSQGICFQYWTVEGIVNERGNRFEIASDKATVCVSKLASNSKNVLLAVFTMNAECAQYNGKYVDSCAFEPEGAWVMLCNLLCIKYANTSNEFALELARNGETVLLEAKNFQDTVIPVATVSGPSGEVSLCGFDLVNNGLKDCKAVKSFSYTATSPEVEKSVSVRKSVAEIYKQIAQYLNRTLVFASFSVDNKLVEQYVSPSGIVEVCIAEDFTMTVHKVAPSAIRRVKPFCVHTTTSSIEDVLRAHSRSRGDTVQTGRYKHVKN